MEEIISSELALLIENNRLKYPFLYTITARYGIYDKEFPGMLCDLYYLDDVIKALKKEYEYDLVLTGKCDLGYKWRLSKNENNKVSDFKFYCTEKCVKEAAIKYFINHILPHINNKNG